jgi:cation diffusion facilitator CzcD-associated flavoprotein CzcO
MIEGRWQEDKQMWTITLQNVKTGEIFHDECNVLIGCHGILNRPRLADIPGRDTFKGNLIHPARWDHSVDLKGKKVAVIGNGSSALQIIPAIYEQVGSLDNYVRSRTWLTSGFGGDLVPVEGVHETRGAGGVNFSYTPEDMAKFKEDKEYYAKYERALRDALACLHLITFKGSPLATGAQKATAELMRSKSLKNPDIAEAIIPDWAIGCRRLTPGTPYIEALCEDKCQMIKEIIERFDETGIVTTGGNHREYDIIILASGYDLTFKVCPMYGKHGVNLNDLYDQAPESYLGVCPPEMPSKPYAFFCATFYYHL